MVTLTEFDGTYWTVAADYRRAGTVLPETPPTTAGRFEVTQQIRVETPGPLSWLPAAGRPTRISVAGLGVDEETGDLVVPREGNVPRAYTATSVLVQPGADQLRYAEPVQANRPVALPPATRQFVEAATRGRPAGSARLLALYDQFVQLGGFRYDVDQEAAGGHGLYQIQRLLTARRGTSEQYASAFAVLARYLGFDARVVMGFRPEYDPGRATAFTVTGRDVDAWAEVRFAGLGWVAMDPSPRTNTVGGKAAPATRPSPPPPSPTPSARSADPASVPPPRDHANGTAGRGGAWTLPAALTGAAVLLAALLAGPAGKTARRVRRRRHRSPRVAVFGAWWETLDRLREAGLPASSAATTADVLAQAGGLAGAVPALRELATMVDRAGYAPEEPDDRLPAGAWAAAADAARRIRGGTGPVRRVLGWFDPRPLWPNR
jgi:transglutaminase-like putative cysteine protease